MNTWFKIQCSQEEIDRVIIEARRLNTWMHDEQQALDTCVQSLESQDRVLAYQVAKLHKYKQEVNCAHAKLIHRMECSPRWEGPHGVGVHQGMAHTRDPPVASSPMDVQGQDIDHGWIAAEAGNRDMSEEDEDVVGEDDAHAKHGLGAMFGVWDALGDGPVSLSEYIDA